MEAKIQLKVVEERTTAHEERTCAKKMAKMAKLICIYRRKCIERVRKTSLVRKEQNTGAENCFSAPVDFKKGYFRKIMSRLMSARVLAPHMAMVSWSSPPILSM